MALILAHARMQIPHLSKPLEAVFQSKMSFNVFLAPDVEGVSGPLRSGLRLIHTHARVPRV
jgi:hypothetical protein